MWKVRIINKFQETNIEIEFSSNVKLQYTLLIKVVNMVDILKNTRI